MRRKYGNHARSPQALRSLRSTRVAILGLKKTTCDESPYVAAPSRHGRCWHYSDKLDKLNKHVNYS